MPYATGDVINQKYQVVGLLGEGGMGKVYKAQQLPLGRLVALKVMRPGRMQPEQRAEFQRRFLQEASLCAQLSHPNIVTVYDYGRIDGDDMCFIAMEYLEGQSLEDRLMDNPLGLSPAESVRLALGIARGLREAHGKGVIHRDLKPANIILLRSDEMDTQVKLLDFGLVKRIGVDDMRMTAAGSFLGTPLYMPPEQASPQEADHRADLYALGVILFECLTGTLPYDGPTPGEVLKAKAAQPPTLRSKRPTMSVSGQLQMLVSKLLQPKPAARYQTADELLLALRALPEAQQTTRDTIQEIPIAPILASSHRYQLGALLSRSPRAQVFEATQEGYGRKVIVKVFLTSSAREASRLQRELPVMLSFQGAGNPVTYEVGALPQGEHSRPYVILEHLSGQTLADLLQREQKLSPLRAVNLFRQALEGLAEIHSHGCVHRNLAPEHMLVSVTSSGRERLVLLSPGLNAAAEHHHKSSPQNVDDVIGQFNRLAPELAQGARRSESTDVYALGVALYESLAGQLPFPASVVAQSTLESRSPQPVPLAQRVPGLSRELLAVVAQAMAPAPRDRFASASQMLVALDLVPEANSAPVRRSLTSISSSQLRLLARGQPTVWVLGGDPAFRKPAVAECLEQLRGRYAVSDVGKGDLSDLIARVEDGSQELPWVILFGDLDVILENPLLASIGKYGEMSRVLISTHANPELLQQSINFCGLDQSLVLPLTPEEISASVDLMIERARRSRQHYDMLRRELTDSTQPAIEIALEPADQRITQTAL